MKKLLSLLLVLVLALSLTACGKQSAEAYIKQEMERFKNGEGLESVQADLGADVVKALLDNFAYTIVSSEESGDTATVTVQVTNLDMYTAVTNWIMQIWVLAFDQALLPVEEQMSEEELNDMMYSLLYTCMMAEDIQPVTQELTLNLFTGEEGWQLVSASMDALTDAMMGGFFTAMAELG